MKIGCVSGNQTVQHNTTSTIHLDIKDALNASLHVKHVQAPEVVKAAVQASYIKVSVEHLVQAIILNNSIMLPKLPNAQYASSHVSDVEISLTFVFHA